ncbi:MAG: hypothetical protein ACRESR_03710 [Gammaproteobacteria bacterium]
MSKATRFLLATVAACAGGMIFTVSAATAPAAASAPAARSHHAAHPLRGMTMTEVVARFGEPTRKLPPDPRVSQGPLKPPIERWIYPYFTVYFEHHWVIHTVLTHPHPPPVLTHTPSGGG